MEEKETPSEVTSGTLDNVRRLLLQVMRGRSWLTKSDVSLGRTVLPIIKQALPACLELSSEAAGMARSETMGAAETSPAPIARRPKNLIVAIRC